MAWGAGIWIISNIFAAALMAGGIVAYRRGRIGGIKSFGAASAAAVFVMWAIVIVTIPVSGG